MKKTRKLRVLQLLPSLNAGGVERGTLEISRALVEAGHESIVVSAVGQLTKELFAHGAEHIELAIGKKSLSVLFFILPLRNILITRAIDIVHVRSRLPAWLLHLSLIFIPINVRPKIVSTVHGLYSVSKYSEIMTKGDRIIAVSKTTEKYIHANYPKCPKNKITVVPRGVSDEEFPYGYKADHEWVKTFFAEFPHLINKKLLLLPGRITRLKGHHDFIALIDELICKQLPVHGLIVGAKDQRRLGYYQELRSEILKRNLNSHITFTGNRSDIKNIYTMASIVYSLSKQPESFGRTVLEPLSLGISTIGYGHGGVGEILNDLQPNGLVKPSDQNSLIMKTQEILNHPTKPKKNFIYTLEKMTLSTIRLYENLNFE